MPGQVETKFVKYEVKDRVAWVTLDRPEAMNALSTALLADLGTVFREIGRDDDVQAEMLREILFSHLAQTEDALEGPRAFAEKRLPNWKMR